GVLDGGVDADALQGLGAGEMVVVHPVALGLRGGAGRRGLAGLAGEALPPLLLGGLGAARAGRVLGRLVLEEVEGGRGEGRGRGPGRGEQRQGEQRGHQGRYCAEVWTLATRGSGWMPKRRMPARATARPAE